VAEEDAALLPWGAGLVPRNLPGLIGPAGGLVEIEGEESFFLSKSPREKDEGEGGGYRKGWGG
jgi:hypothetical protein